MNHRNFIFVFLTGLLIAALLCGCSHLPKKGQPAAVPKISKTEEAPEGIINNNANQGNQTDSDENSGIINNSTEQDNRADADKEPGIMNNNTEQKNQTDTAEEPGIMNNSTEQENQDSSQDENDVLIVNPGHSGIPSHKHTASLRYQAPIRLAGADTEDTIIQRATEVSDSGQIIEKPTIVYPEKQPVLQKSVAIAQLTPLSYLPPQKLNSGSAIYFGTGETSAIISGYVQAGSYVSYNLYAFADQNFLVLLSSDSGTSVLGITDAYGNSYLDPNQHQTSYQMYLPQTNTYYINVYSTGATENFTIQVFIPARVTFQRNRTSQSYTGNIGPYGVVSYTCYIYAGQEIRIDDYSGITPTSYLRVSGLQTGTVYQDYTNYSPSWYAVAPVTQDYLIEVISTEQSSYYKLTVDVR